MNFIPTITAFEKSPDQGRGLARDTIVRWALEEVGQPYDVRLVSFKELKEGPHLKLNPFGKIPTYEEAGLQVFETGAIVLHIAETRDGLLNKHPNIRMRQIAWMFAAASTVEPPIVELSAAFLLEQDKPWYQQRLPLLEENVRVRLRELSKRLSNGHWLDFEFSAADVMMIGVLRRLARSGLLNEFSNLADYVARGEARPAFQRAFAAQLAVFTGPQTSGADQVASIIKEIAKLLYALSELETDRFLQKFNQAPTTINVYDAILELESAANSKELRDTGDERVHQLCEQIRLQARKLHPFFRVSLIPNSEQQKENWTKAFGSDPGAKYMFKEDGSLEVSAIESELAGSTLNIKRLWSRHCNYDGSRVDFKLELDAEQAKAFKKKASEFIFNF